jgi:hypothetical protein
MIPSLRQYDFTPLSIPVTSRRVSPVKDVFQSDVGFRLSRTRITSLLFRYSSQVYGMGTEVKPLSSVVIWNHVHRQLAEIRKTLRISDRAKKVRLSPVMQVLERIVISTEVSQSVVVSHVHGMLTPWNMQYSELRLFSHDWEVRSNATPLFFDQFHHMFCELVLREQKDAEAWFTFTGRSLEGLSQRRVAQRHAVDLDLHFRLYVLFLAVNHMRRIIGQSESSDEDFRILHVFADAGKQLLSGHSCWKKA